MSMIVFSIVATILLTVLNGFFSMSEMALTTAKRASLEHDAEEGDKRAVQALELASDSTDFLATIQVAITLVGFFSATVSSNTLSDPLASWMESFGLAPLTAVAPVAVVGLLAVTCMLILVVFGYVQLYEASERVSSLQSELSELQEQRVVLESLYEEGIDLPYIEERAAELGLSLPGKDQTVYLNLSGSDQAEIYASESTNIFQRILQAIERSASGLVEYLS